MLNVVKADSLVEMLLSADQQRCLVLFRQHRPLFRQPSAAEPHWREMVGSDHAVGRSRLSGGFGLSGLGGGLEEYYFAQNPEVGSEP